MSKFPISDGSREKRHRSRYSRYSSFLLLLISLISPALHAQEADVSQREITFNGRTLSEHEWRTLQAVERKIGVRFPDGNFWYDNRSGAVGTWGGPALGFLMPELPLGGPMPAECSGGGTDVFVNGRELHPLEVAALSRIGPVWRGRYWLDANGDYGLESGPRLGNLVAIARRQGSPAPGPHRVYGPGELSGVFGNSAGYCTDSGCIYLGQ
jgi:hypothetical protein